MIQIEKVQEYLYYIYALHLKHPDRVIPLKSALIPCSELPMFEDVEITGSHIIWVALSIQGAVGPGCYEAIHWRDSLLWFGAHSERLRVSVASLRS